MSPRRLVGRGSKARRRSLVPMMNLPLDPDAKIFETFGDAETCSKKVPDATER